MKRIIAVLIFSTSIHAYARWDKFDHNAHGQRYVNSRTIKRTLPLVRVQTLLDLTKPVGKGRSMLLINEINCMEESLRILTVIGYTGAMATGSAIHEAGWDKPGTWQYIAPGTASENLFAYACK